MDTTTIARPAQPRENAVPCAVCRKSTWNTDRICDRHDAKAA